VLGLVLFASCKKEDPLADVDNIQGLGGDTWAQGPIDKWIYDNLTVPYNIAVKYKWDQSEIALNRTVVPVREEQVIPVLGAIKKAWIDVYEAEAGNLFVKRYTPKFFVLEGSGSYNPDGTATLGTAEGGRKVVLYQLNYFRTKDMAGYRPSDSLVIREVLHTIHHEFGHILHQTVMYPLEYKRISIGLYTANWNNVSRTAALQDGFITPYSMSKPDEDFVEMIATMLTEGKAGFDRIVNSISGTSPNGTTAAEAKSRLRQKEDLVVDYFNKVWKIDFYSLQRRTRTAVEALIQ
ncbi:MAG TPA: putative zinc-binding metallopeptidase, partial [Flavisolibacter sp.]|nr:putative zinc-binding metallopeptidase [Flavisolibacter sp.]